MSNSRDIDAAEHLRRLVVRGIVEQTGLNEEHAMPYATAVLTVLQNEYGGERLHIPKAAAQEKPCARMQVIRAELAEGQDWRMVCRRHGVSRAALYRMFPGGLPKPSRAS